MFQVNDQTEASSLDQDKIVSVLQSVNEPMVAAADHPAEATKAYICVLNSENGGALEMHILLYLTQSATTVIYSWDESPFDAAIRSEVEEEALDFVESMGFMMDNMNLAKLPASERQKLFAEIPAFKAETAMDLEMSDALPADELEGLVESGPMTRSGESIGQADGLAQKPSTIPGREESFEESSGEFDEALALESLEEEFGREEASFDELDSALADLLPQGSSPKIDSQMKTKPTPKKKSDDSRLRAIIRLMASF